MRISRIVTHRAEIRCYQISEAPLLKSAIDSSLPELLRWMTWAIDNPQTLAQKELTINRFIEAFNNNTDYTFAILNLAETELLGSTGQHTRLEPTDREIDYWIHTRHTGNGLATHAVQALAQLAFIHPKMRV
jgi:Acetyltransferases, including N-acetylases of ribosomal proteins